MRRTYTITREQPASSGGLRQPAVFDSSWGIAPPNFRPRPENRRRRYRVLLLRIVALVVVPSF